MPTTGFSLELRGELDGFADGIDGDGVGVAVADGCVDVSGFAEWGFDSWALAE